jgi:hypothetical protein
MIRLPLFAGKAPATKIMQLRVNNNFLIRLRMHLLAVPTVLSTCKVWYIGTSDNWSIVGYANSGGSSAAPCSCTQIKKNIYIFF